MFADPLYRYKQPKDKWERETEIHAGEDQAM
jgi:hypothetical protein